MKKSFFIFTIFLFSCFLSYSQEPIKFAKSNTPIFIDSTIKSFVIRYFKAGIVEVEYTATSDYVGSVMITVTSGSKTLDVYFTGNLKKGEKYSKIVSMF